MKRLDQFLSQLKYGSRSEVEKMIKQGLVTVNGVIAKSGRHKIDPLVCEVHMNGQKVFYKEPIDIILYKPQGYISSNKDERYPSVINLIKAPYDRFDFKIAGRLDWDTEGLLILTTDGKLVQKITHPNKKIPKVYEVKLDKSYQEEIINQLLKGVEIKDGKNETYLAKALKLEYQKDLIYITIDEGKFHQVKRMFSSVGYEVIKLKRIKIGHLDLSNLSVGEYKEFNRNDIF
ncbi:MAG: rRNA pseudouridine synthase [Candidatus Phytoplasma sp.]|nr:rRNA pseudouridine synthase [Phytoplasma sp.]